MSRRPAPRLGWSRQACRSLSVRLTASVSTESHPAARRQAGGQEPLAQRSRQDRDLRIGDVIDRDVDVRAAPLDLAAAVRFPSAPSQTCDTPSVSDVGGSKISGVLIGTAGTPQFG